MIPDSVVIGAGMAGLTAALRLAEGGQRVLLVAKGMGSTHLSGGTVDVLGYDPGLVASPAGALPAFLDANPGHPYRHVGVAGVAAALEWFKARVQTPRYVGDAGRNFLLPTAIGVPRPAAAVPLTMAAGDVRGGGRFAVVAIPPLRDFHAPLLAANLSAARLPGGGTVSARPVVADLGAGPGGEVPTDVSPVALARRLDDPAARARLVEVLAPRLRPGEVAAFPAVLGLDDPEQAWEDLEAGLERPVFEIPTLPPSAPGLRLFRCLREALRKAGVTVVLGAEATGAVTEGDQVRSVQVEVAGRTRAWRAGSFVLAGGGWASGGLRLDSRWRAWEPVFGLPVAGVPAAGEPRFLPGYFDHHPMARAGIATDGALRPVDGDGRVRYRNLHVAGAMLAGAEPWREKSGDGISLTTGWRAASVILGEES